MTKVPVTIPRYTLIAYHRDKKRNPIGAVVAMRVGDEIRFGASLCMKSDRKGFSKSEALGRAIDNILSDYPMIPDSMQKTYLRVYERALKYYHCEIK